MQKTIELRYDSVIAQVMLSAMLNNNMVDFVDSQKADSFLVKKNDNILLDENKFGLLKNITDLTSVNSIVRNLIVAYIDPEFKPHQKWLASYQFTSSRHMVKKVYEWWLEQPQEFINATEDIMFEVKLLISGYNQPV